MSALQKHPASFRDPSGFVFEQNGVFYRVVNKSYAADYDALMKTGLYQKLVNTGRMLPVEDVTNTFPSDNEVYKVLRPQQLHDWTYPYEWCFGQLKAAALLTLELNLAALQHDLILKDATAYNIQFIKNAPVLIDSLSFERYEQDKPWQAFRQFCEHFLYPLLLMKQLPTDATNILRGFPDGLPVAIVKKLLPFKGRFSLNNWMYVYLPASVGSKQQTTERKFRVTKQSIIQNITQLRSFIGKLSVGGERSQWNNYYEETILSKEYFDHKSTLVDMILSELHPQTVTDMGSNTGEFSRIAAKYATRVVALDSDPMSVDRLYQVCREEQQHCIAPMVADVCNPSPATGWENKEHSPLLSRIKSDCVLALAVVHHLALSKNITLDMITDLLADLTKSALIVEFVPKSDPRAGILLRNKKDIYHHYTQDLFEESLSRRFQIESKHALAAGERTLYVLRKRND